MNFQRLDYRRSRGKQAWSIVLVAVIASQVLAACASPAPTPTAEPAAAVPATVAPAPDPTMAPEPTTAPAPTAKAPTQFVFAHSGPIRTLDAPVTWFGSTHWLTNLMYDCLIWRKADGSGYVGQSAEKWEAVNETTWRFYLRKGLTFQNGEPLDAEAVKWNIDRTRTTKEFMVMPQWAFVKEVKVVDATTVDILTNGPEAYFEYVVSYNGCELLPPKYYQQVGAEEFAKKPVGSGPYKLAEFTASEKYVFEAWDQYWGGRPEVDKVIYQVIPEKASQIAALLAGQVDMVMGIPSPDLASVEAADGIVTQNETSNQLHLLYLRSETGSGKFKEKYPNYQPLTMDKKIRQAINHALDRTTLAEINGNSLPTLVRLGQSNPESYSEKYAGPDVSNKWFDQELARKLIMEAGFDPAAGKKPKLYMDSPANNSGNEKEVAEVIRVMLEDVGFQVELNIMDYTAYAEQVDSPGYNREIALVTLGGSASLVPKFYTCEWKQATYNVCEKEYDALGKEILKTVDPVKRKELWGKWWEFFVDYSQTVPLYEMNKVYAMNDKFVWKPRVDGWVTMRDLTLKK